MSTAATQTRVEVGIEGNFVVRRAEDQDPSYVWVEFVNHRGQREFAMEMNAQEVRDLIGILEPHSAT